jgi:hypothetical protein
MSVEENNDHGVTDHVDDHIDVVDDFVFEDLLQKSRTLLTEIDTFVSFVKSKNVPEGQQEYRRFRNDVQQELSGLETVRRWEKKGGGHTLNDN